MTSSPLVDIIRRRIRQLGPMDMAEYMGLCLGHPEHGYYMTRDPFGAAGDFTTAPEVSQMFGEMIGLWLADLWMKTGRPESFILLEVGPGRGTLMDDIMRSTKHVSGFHEAAKVHLMEISPVLRNAQSQKLQRYLPCWITDLSQLDSAVPVFVVGNEFLDALPIRQIILSTEGVRERAVGLGDNDTLVLGVKYLDDERDRQLVDAIPRHLMEAGLSSEEGRIFETAPFLNQFLKWLHKILLKQGGVALFLDYGHVRSNFGDTVQAMRAHKFVDILDQPGESDLTAHVDFENISRLATEDGVSVHGPVTQSAFLRALGIERRLESLLKGANPVQAEALRSGLNRLIDTQQMGTLFKVIALCPDSTIKPEGFYEDL